MAIKVEELYWRLYADYQHKVFTLTMVPLSEPTHHELVAHKETLKALAQGLQAIGWTPCQRKAFESVVRRQVSTNQL
jgi:hypothetical protein